MKHETKRQLFLSYAHPDVLKARKVYRDLMRFSVDVWFDEVSLLPGQEWKVEIQRAIRGSTHFLALLSSSSVDHVGYVQKELRIALDVLDLYPQANVFVLPARLDDCRPSHDRIRDLHWIDLFPDPQYEAGIRRLLEVVQPDVSMLRSSPAILTQAELVDTLRRHGLFDVYLNPAGWGVRHSYTVSEFPEGDVVADQTTGLMWQRSGAPAEFMTVEQAVAYVQELNSSVFGGFSDWRLPSVEEAMSLMERSRTSRLYIDPVFGDGPAWVWTCDTSKGWRGHFERPGTTRMWFVSYAAARCSQTRAASRQAPSVRLVRSM